MKRTFAGADRFLSGPDAGKPTKKTPGEERQQFGFAPGCSPGAAEMNYVLNQADTLVEKLEFLPFLNWSPEEPSGTLLSTDVIGMHRPTSGGSLLVTSKEVIWIPETSQIDRATQYTPFGAATLTGIVACNNVTTIAAQSRNVLLCLREAGNINGFGAGNLMWPRTDDASTGLGQQFFVSLIDSGTGERHGAWDEVHQVVHVADAEKIVSFVMTPDFVDLFPDTDFDMIDNPWGFAIGTGVRVRCGGGAAVVFGVANGGERSYYSHDGGVTWQKGITLGNELIPPNVTSGLTRYVAHWYSEYAECWYLLVQGIEEGDPRLHCYRSVDNGVTWDFLENWTEKLRFYQLTPGVPKEIARVGHRVAFAFPTQPDVLEGGGDIRSGMVVFDEIKRELRTIDVFGGTSPIGVFSDGVRLLWAREHTEDELILSLSQSGALPPPLPR